MCEPVCLSVCVPNNSWRFYALARLDSIWSLYVRSHASERASRRSRAFAFALRPALAPCLYASAQSNQESARPKTSCLPSTVDWQARASATCAPPANRPPACGRHRRKSKSRFVQVADSLVFRAHSSCAHIHTLLLLFARVCHTAATKDNSCSDGNKVAAGRVLPCESSHFYEQQHRQSLTVLCKLLLLPC